MADQMADQIATETSGCPGQWVCSDPPSSVAMTEKLWTGEQRALIGYCLTIHRSCDRENFTNDMNESQKWQKTLLGRMFCVLLEFLVSVWLGWSVFYWFCKLRLMLTVLPSSGLCHVSFCAFTQDLLWKYGTSWPTKMSPRSVGDLALLAGCL